jgi:glycosyltransferase involved in cell wall biosynthesis
MNIWLITIGEPVPLTKDSGERLQRTGFFAHFLAENGHDVTWWTSTFDHFRKIHHYSEDTEVILNKRLIVKLLYGGGYPSNLSWRRILDHQRIAVKFSIQARHLSPPDIILCAFPTIELSLAAVRYGREHNVPVVLDLRDMWPDIFLNFLPKSMRTIGAVLIRWMFNKAREAFAQATAITGITEAFVDWGLAKAGRTRTELDQSFPMGYTLKTPPLLKIQEAEKFWDERGIIANKNCFNVCFFGTLGRHLDLETVVRAAHRIKGKNIPIYFIICGAGDYLEYFKKLAGHNGNILFPGWVNASQIYVLMRRVKVGLDPLPKRHDFLSTINNKAIEYLSASLPVIASPNCGVLHDLLHKHHCGVTYPHGDEAALSEIILNLYNNGQTLQEMSKNATRLFKKTFRAEKVYGAMMGHLNEIAQDKSFII